MFVFLDFQWWLFDFGIANIDRKRLDPGTHAKWALFYGYPLLHKGPNSKRKQTIDFDTFYQTPFGDPKNV